MQTAFPLHATESLSCSLFKTRMDKRKAGICSVTGRMLEGGLYVHVAYCRRKCIYCDFFSAGERIADWHGYVDALCSEFLHRLNELAWPLRTVYFGGGTPSLMPAEEFLRLCSFLKPYMSEVEEFTVEVNPDDVDAHMLDVWKRGGVNRLSMGIQTFDDSVLKSIARRHDSACALEAYRLASEVFGNISVDLIFGLPGQTIDVWRRDLDMALDLHPAHISAYSLMYEDGTALTALRDSGRIKEASEELSESMFRMLIDQLSEHGYEHYEISNFALPGYRSRHNTSYWLQKPYIGLGPSAHSYDGLTRRKSNLADIRGYIRHWTEYCGGTDVGRQPYEMESLTVDELKEEYLLTRMRMREGIPIGDFSDRFGQEACRRLMESCRPLAENGLIEMSDYNLSLTEKAVMLSDSVILSIASHF